MEKLDPYRSKEAYARWKCRTQDGVPELSQPGSLVLKRFLDDMERGVNVATGTRKGGRTYKRLNSGTVPISRRYIRTGSEVFS